MVRFSLSVKVLVVTLSATANWVCFIYMSNGSILINRAAKVLTVSRPGSKLLPNVTWFLFLLGLLITIILLLIFGLCFLIYLSSLFLLRIQWLQRQRNGDVEILVTLQNGLPWCSTLVTNAIMVYKLSLVENYLECSNCNHLILAVCSLYL